MPYIVCVEGHTEGEEWYVGTPEVKLGRSKDVEVPVFDVKVSREHARIFFKGGRHEIEDLGSTNGTFVEGKKIQKPTPLHNDQFFQVGQSLFLYTSSSIRERVGQIAHQINDPSFERAELFETAKSGALHEIVQDVISKKRVHVRHSKKIKPGSLKWMLRGLDIQKPSKVDDSSAAEK